MVVVMGPIMEIPVSDLFAAGIVPGILLACLYAAYTTLRCFLNPKLGPPIPEELRTTDLKKLWLEFFLGLVPPAALVFAALGSILFGFATPTEAAGCGAGGALLLSLAYKKLTFKKDGALWFKSTDFGDDKDRVLLRENGEPTYYLTDVGYHKDKIDRKYEHYINIFGADHHGYVKRITSAFDTLKNDYQSLEIVLYQLVNLFENGKKKQMSTRKGDFYSLEELREEIGSDVIKFFFLEKKSDHTIDFDVLKAKEESKTNPYFYTQYAHVRCCSILQNKTPDFKCMYDEKEITKNFDLLNKIINYQKHLQDFANERSPHSLVHFLKELAADFHSFYETNPVLVENDTVANSRLIITKATQIVLQNGLELLSVKPLSKM